MEIKFFRTVAWSGVCCGNVWEEIKIWFWLNLCIKPKINKGNIHKYLCQLQKFIQHWDMFFINFFPTILNVGVTKVLMVGWKMVIGGVMELGKIYCDCIARVSDKWVLSQKKSDKWGEKGMSVWMLKWQNMVKIQMEWWHNSSHFKNYMSWHELWRKTI